ncbi:hypothetical protein B4100_2509 [Heyndrickxia coagulans]|nr:hypothetical protein B4100_2509 [Heyndrickxia coagulans]
MKKDKSIWSKYFVDLNIIIKLIIETSTKPACKKVSVF